MIEPDRPSARLGDAGQHLPRQLEPAAPLILTLALHAAEQARFDRLRAAHFPPGRNLVPAHITLFHQLPGQETVRVRRLLSPHSAAISRRFPLAVTGVRSLGRGVAYRLEAPELSASAPPSPSSWDGWLTPQDRQPYRPHLTIQNKADPAAAARLLRHMQAEFAPFAVQAEGLLLWHYRGGPWELAARFAFTPPPTTRP